MLTFFNLCALAVLSIDSIKESEPAAPVVSTPPRSLSESEKKPRITKKKTTKLTLPADEDEQVAESASSQDEPTTDLSQDFFPEFSQKSSNSNSVLLSSLSKNRFSLGNIPVAKLKKSSKNPFATSSPAATTLTSAFPAKVQDKQPKKRGRPPKVKQQ